MAAAGVDHDVKVYEEAGHGFMNQVEGHRVMRMLTRPVMTVAYNRDAAEDAWARVETFFGRHLANPYVSSWSACVHRDVVPIVP